jgi:hypothetical protein
MTLAIDRHGNRRELREGDILQDGEKIVIGMRAMDGSHHRFHDGLGFAAGMRPGPIIPSGTPVADKKRDEAFTEYMAATSKAWRPVAQRDDVGDQPASSRDTYVAWLQNAWRGGR